MKISVIIPTWNRAATIQKAVESALAQTLQPFEILVCDDGSTDDTKAIVENMKNSLVRFIAGEHSGNAGAPRNAGIAAAKGDYIAFLDSDDAWLPKKLEKQVADLQATGLLACATNAWRILPDQEAHASLNSFTGKTASFKKLLRDNVIICSSVLIHISLLEKADGFPEFEAKTAINEDYALWLRIATEHPFSYISEPLLNYNDDAVHSFRSKNTKGPYEQKKYVLKDLSKLKENKKSKKYLHATSYEYIRTSLIQLLK